MAKKRPKKTMPENTSQPTDPINLFTFTRSTIPSLFATVDRLEHAIGLPPGFYEKLVEGDDDWSFVLKVHALLEASITMVLAERIGGSLLPDSSDLVNTLSRLEMSRTDVGKVKLALILGIVDERQSRLLRFLSELRNTFVHDIKNVRLTLPQYVSSLNPDQQTSFVQRLFSGTDARIHQNALAHPRRCIWLAVLMLLMNLRTRYELLQVTRGAPGTSKTAFVREAEALQRDVDALQARINEQGTPESSGTE